MIRRSIKTGLFGGFLLSLSGLYPIVGLMAPIWLKGWERPFTNELVHGIWLMGSAALAVPTFVSLGFLAAHRTGARGWREGAKAGMLAGLAAGMFCFVTLVLPVNALIAYGTLTAAANATVDAASISADVLSQYVLTFERSSMQLELTLAGSALFWGTQGLIIGWWRRNRPAPERPTLFGLLEDGQHPQTWFTGDETSVQTGLLVGFLISLLTILVTSGRSYVLFVQDWPELAAVMQDTHTSMIVTDSVSGVLSLLSPLFALALLGFGAIVVLLIKNPPDRIRARVRAVINAGVVIAISGFAVLLRFFLFTIGLLPFWFLRLIGEGADPEINANTEQALENLTALFAAPGALIMGVLAVAWATLLVALIVGVLVGILQGGVYAGFLAWIYKRPVDKAAVLHRQIKRDPDNVLPRLQNLFSQTSHAYDMLAHLVVRTYQTQPELSRLAAAYHTLGTSAEREDYVHTTQALHTMMSEHRTWKWGLDLGASYRTLHQVLTANTLEQILEIEPPPEQHTSSLPPLVVKSGQQIGRIVKELHKVEKVEDLQTKLIFLENSLNAIEDGRGFVQTVFLDPEQFKSTLPQKAALADALDHWQAVVLKAIKRLKGRADVVSIFKSRHCNFMPELPLTCQVTNQGLNVAQQVRVKLLPGSNYHLLGVKSEGMVEILPPGEAKELSLFIMPDKGVPRIRVAWELVYDDAVDAERQLQFADMIEFSEPDRPFERIFPIPYVTGTPLKTDDVFVGREDVFKFIQENLVGAHQNNIIILHGQRRTGKTSVLYRLGQVMADTHYGVLIDMQGKPARGEVDFLYSIADDITFALEDYGIEVGLPPRTEFEESPEFFFRSRFVRSLYPHLDGKNLLLMFDEFEELQQRVEDGRLQPDIFQFLRNLMQHDERVDFIFAGTHKLEELGAEYWSTLFNIAAYRPITFLSSVEMKRLILEPVADYNVEYDPLAIDRIIQVTAGHPYFAQLVLHEMIVYHNEMQVSYLTVVDVEQVLERIVDRGETHFRYIWSESSDEERLVLRALAELMVSQDMVNYKELRSFLSERGHTSKDVWKTALAGLESRDILNSQEAKTPLYRFRVDLLRLWISHTRPPL